MALNPGLPTLMTSTRPHGFLPPSYIVIQHYALQATKILAYTEVKKSKFDNFKHRFFNPFILLKVVLLWTQCLIFIASSTKHKMLAGSQIQYALEEHS